MGRILLTSLIIILSLSSCNTGKKYVKRAYELEQNGLTYEAVDFYLRALSRNPNNVEARIAVKRTAQKVLDEMQADFYTSYTSSSNKDALYKYQEAQNFHKRVTGYGVKLDLADNYDGYYQEVKSAYLKEVYEEALLELDQENFKKAREKLLEINKIDPDYEKVSELKLFAELEPEYRNAIDQYENQLYRKAYYSFEKVIKKKADYKQASQYLQRSLEAARFTIAISSFENSTRQRGVHDAISSEIISRLSTSGNPFIKLIDRSKLQEILREQKLGMTASHDPKSVAEAGRLLGAKVLLTGSLVLADEKEGSLQKTIRKGYLGREVKKRHPDTRKEYIDIEYRKVYYNEYQKTNTVHYLFNYQLISAETGEILAADNITVELDDQVKYATYEGNSRLLYPGRWDSLNRHLKSDRVYTGRRDKRNLDGLISGNRNIKSLAQLRISAVKDIGQRVSNSVIKFEN